MILLLSYIYIPVLVRSTVSSFQRAHAACDLSARDVENGRARTRIRKRRSFRELE